MQNTVVPAAPDAACQQVPRGLGGRKAPVALQGRFDMARGDKAMDPGGTDIAAGGVAAQPVPGRKRMGRPPGRTGIVGATAKRLLLLLERPRHGPELHLLLGVSRQRVHQLLDDLFELGLIRPADPDHPSFAIARSDDSTLLLRAEQERMLSVLPEGTATTLTKIAKAMNRSAADVELVAQSLIDAGLVEKTGKRKRRDLFGLTPLGAAHWQRSPTAVRAAAPPPPFRSDRVFNLLSYLAAHGAAYPREIAGAFRIRVELVYALINQLKLKNVVRNQGNVRRAPYELTAFGRSVLDEWGS